MPRAAATDVLFLAHRLPFPPDRGDRITTWNLLRAIIDTGARVRIATFLWHAEDAAGKAELERLGCEVFAPARRPWSRRLLSLAGLCTARPLTLHYFGSRRLTRILRASVRRRRPDVCFAYSSSMGAYYLRLSRELAGVPKVMHFAELDSDKWRQLAERGGPAARLVYGREARTMLAFERRLAAAADLNLVVSRVEADLFRARIPGAPVEVLPNGVDLDHFRPGTDGEKIPGRIVFTGVMNYPPNVDAVKHFVESVWPRVRSEHPEASFAIVGRDPDREVRRLAALPGVLVTGRVRDTAPWLRQAVAAVAPLRIARGIQNKVLEAMASGLPVVCTPKALEGIDAEVGAEVLVAAEPDGTAAALGRLLADPGRARRIGAAARRRVEQGYDWRTIRARFVARLSEVQARGSGSREAGNLA